MRRDAFGSYGLPSLQIAVDKEIHRVRLEEEIVATRALPWLTEARPSLSEGDGRACAGQRCSADQAACNPRSECQ